MTRPHLRLACGALVACGCLIGCERTPAAGEALRVVGRFGEVGTNPGQFVYPRAIDADDRGVWVIDKSARVQRIDPSTGRPTAIWRMAEFANGKPTGITIGPSPEDPSKQAVWVPETHYQRVTVFEPPARSGQEPRILAQFGEYGTGPGQFTFPTDVAVLTDRAGAIERIYVSEYGGNDRISVFDATYRFLFAIGSFGMGDGKEGTVEFNRPQSIAIDTKRRELIVADACNHRIGRLSLDGALIAWYGGPEEVGQQAGRFNYPYGLALLDDGTVLVAEMGNSRVQRIDLETGRSLGVWGRKGNGPDELASPWGVATREGVVWVLDSGHSRVLGFRSPRG